MANRATQTAESAQNLRGATKVSQPPFPGAKKAYGAWWRPDITELGIELVCFRQGLAIPDSLGRVEHFKRAVHILWGPSNKKKKFVWHPWAERMLEVCCEEIEKDKAFVGIAGCGSSGKCLAPHQEVLMYDGSLKQAKDVVVGDQLMGDDSTPRNVVHRQDGHSKMVRITPLQGGKPWECNDDHILCLRNEYGSVVEISVRDYSKKDVGFKREYLQYAAGGQYPDTRFLIHERGDGDWAGFRVDGNGRFLLGDFTVTHNSEFAAVWGLINWMSSPGKTMVLVTSTSLKDSRKRIWGAIRDYFLAIPGRAQGKLVDSQGLIRYDMGGAASESSERAGIALIAAEKSKEKEAVGKLIGFKNDRVILIADELPELTEAIVHAAYSNLALNPKFQMIAMGNPASMYDAFGVFVQPKNGWGSIHAGSEEWETIRGKCIRFDGEKSPNVLAGKTVYPWLITAEFLEQQKEALGENSAAYWRMIRGYWSPTGAADAVYSEADILLFKADQPAVWLTPPVRVAALDPAFTSGGDRSALYFGSYGDSRDGIKTLCFDRVEFLQEDVTDKDTPRAFQIVKQFKDKCLAAGVLPENACFDATGAGGPLGDIIAREWSPKVRRTLFGGKASDLPAGAADNTPGHERYSNRVSEIWFSGKALMRTGQLRGVTPTLARELCARIYATDKGSSMRIRVESKVDMKMRIGKSPDEADAALMLVDLCRDRFGFGVSRDRELGKSGQTVDLKKYFSRLNSINAGRSLASV